MGILKEKLLLVNLRTFNVSFIQRFKFENSRLKSQSVFLFLFCEYFWQKLHTGDSLQREKFVFLNLVETIKPIARLLIQSFVFSEG